MKTTDGKWKASEENCGGGFNIFAGGLRIGHTTRVVVMGRELVSEEQAKLNAILMAAAPTLLKCITGIYAQTNDVAEGEMQDVADKCAQVIRALTNAGIDVNGVE